MEITPVDLADDQELREAYGLERRAVLFGREEMPYWSWSEYAGAWRHPDPGEKAVLLAGRDGGRLVAQGIAYLSVLDNTDKSWLVVNTDPEHRGHGYGRAMLAHLEALSADEGRTTLLGEARIPFEQVADHPYRRFAEAAGYRYSNVEVVRHLALPVPEADLDRWSAEAAAKHDGYRIETYLNGVPAELEPSLCVLLGQLSVDAPTGEADFEEEVITPERYRDNLDGLVKAGRRVYESVAVTSDGVVAAQSTLSVPPDGRTDMGQWGTFVHREHRGRRLGLAVKAANLRTAQRAHPAMRRVVTQNAETNDWMVAINVQMGFAPVEASVEFIKSVS